jgi:hypothetical protein
MSSDPPKIDGRTREGSLASVLSFAYRKAQLVWLRIRRLHFVWEITFALLLAVYFAYYYSGFDRPQYGLYILLGDDIPNTTGETIKSILKQPAQNLKVNGTDVNVNVITIPARTSDDAIKTAENIVKNRDAFLVVGVLDSEPTERSLPVYLGARPQVPFIAAVQSNNNLLRNCKECFDSDKPVPLLQISPTNADQAKWAVKFALDRGMQSFLIVRDDQSANTSYVEGLATAYDQEIPRSLSRLGTTVSGLTEKLASSQEHPACVLYAGDPGNAKSLLTAIARTAGNHRSAGPPWKPTVILSDTAVPSSMGTVTYPSVVLLTDQSDAAYYSSNDEPNAYGLDAVTIAVSLLRELNERGFDWKVSLKSELLNRTSAEDIRRNLVRIMQEDSEFHTSYRGANNTGPTDGLSTAYNFDCPTVSIEGRIQHKSDGSADYCQRYGGIFHVWQWDPQRKVMTDIDFWHPQRTTAPRR